VSLVSQYVHDEQGREVLSIGNRAATDPSLSLPSSEYAATARSLNSHVHLLQPEEPIPLEWSLYRMVTVRIVRLLDKPIVLPVFPCQLCGGFFV
jgi:hypothetical protein